MSSAARMSSLRLTELVRTPRPSLGKVRFTSSAHGAHGTHQHLPFTYSNKKTFATKYAAFCLTGFSIPFIAVTWQLHKSGGVA